VVNDPPLAAAAAVANGAPCADAAPVNDALVGLDARPASGTDESFRSRQRTSDSSRMMDPGGRSARSSRAADSMEAESLESRERRIWAPSSWPTTCNGRVGSEHSDWLGSRERGVARGPTIYGGVCVWWWWVGIRALGASRVKGRQDVGAEQQRVS
jgi:hypothetical protein